MHPKRSVIRHLPHAAQNTEGIFWFLFNMINLLNGIIGLITNVIDFFEDIFGGGGNA
jgi:hypothetical protein